MPKFSEVKQSIGELPENKQEIALRLLAKVEFMDAELEELQKVLKEKGWTEPYQNGQNQCGIKKSSEADVYNSLMKNYSTAIKQLLELIPAKSGGTSLQDEMKQLINE